MVAAGLSSVPTWRTEWDPKLHLQFPRDADVDGMDVASPPERFEFKKALLPSGEGGCRGRANGTAEWLPSVGIHARGHIDGEDRRARGVDVVNVLQQRTGHRSIQSGAE